jgi:hypothetical protein
MANGNTPEQPTVVQLVKPNLQCQILSTADCAAEHFFFTDMLENSLEGKFYITEIFFHDNTRIMTTNVLQGEVESKFPACHEFVFM